MIDNYEKESTICWYFAPHLTSTKVLSEIRQWCVRENIICIRNGWSNEWMFDNEEQRTIFVLRWAK